MPELSWDEIGEQLMYQMMHSNEIQWSEKGNIRSKSFEYNCTILYTGKFGFQNGGIRKSYYTDNHEDALVMWVNLYEK